MAYPFAAALTGWLAERGYDRRYLTSMLAMLAGLATLFAGGVLWLAFAPQAGATGLPAALAAGFYPFVLPDVLKVAVAALILPSAWRFADPS
jgi:biotin transport system substrate-specific component